ncbi:hypothetical protein FOA52_009418, partial [Chlamydomonas sp. UWO 241]
MLGLYRATVSAQVEENRAVAQKLEPLMWDCESSDGGDTVQRLMAAVAAAPAALGGASASAPACRADAVSMLRTGLPSWLPMAEVWRWESNGEVLGPYSAKHLSQWITCGKVSRYGIVVHTDRPGCYVFVADVVAHAQQARVQWEAERATFAQQAAHAEAQRAAAQWQLDAQNAVHAQAAAREQLAVDTGRLVRDSLMVPVRKQAQRALWLSAGGQPSIVAAWLEEWAKGGGAQRAAERRAAEQARAAEAAARAADEALAAEEARVAEEARAAEEAVRAAEEARAAEQARAEARAAAAAAWAAEQARAAEAARVAEEALVKARAAAEAARAEEEARHTAEMERAADAATAAQALAPTANGNVGGDATHSMPQQQHCTTPQPRSSLPHDGDATMAEPDVLHDGGAAPSSTPSASAALKRKGVHDDGMAASGTPPASAAPKRKGLVFKFAGAAQKEQAGTGGAPAGEGAAVAVAAAARPPEQ